MPATPAWSPFFYTSLAIASDGNAANVPILFNFAANSVIAGGDTIVSSPAPVLSQIRPNNNPDLTLTLGAITGTSVTVQVSVAGGYGGQDYDVSCEAHTEAGNTVVLTCVLSTTGGYVANFTPSGRQAGGVTDAVGGLTVTNGRITDTTTNPFSFPRSTFAALPAASAVEPGTVYQLTDMTRGRVASNGTRWVDVSGGVVNSNDFNDDPTGATSSWTAWQNALNALSQIGNGKLVIPAPPTIGGFYKYDKTLVRQPFGNQFNCTINIEFLGRQNQIVWTGPAYSVGLLTIGNYNSVCRNFSPRNINNVDGFVAFDNRTDYWHWVNTQCHYIHCAPNIGSGKNGIGFRTGQGGTPDGIAGGEGLDHGYFISCSVFSASTLANPLGNIGYLIGGNNSHPMKGDHCYTDLCDWFYWAGAKYTNPTSPYFGPNDCGATSINVVSTVGFPPSGFALIWSTFNASPCELIYYTGITSTSFTGVTRGLNGTSPLQGTANTIVALFDTDVYGGYAFTTASVGSGDTTISVNSGNALAASGTIQINATSGTSGGVVGGGCYPYETINYSANSGGTLTVSGRAQQGSPATAFPFNLPPPLPAAMSASGSSGSWSAETAWGQITYVNASGETTASTIVSVAVSASNSLTITKPAATSYTANGPATGWNFYLGVGSSQPANTAMYLQNSLPLSLGSNLVLTAPTLSGANPPSTNTATGGNGFAVFQRLYGPSMGSLLPDGVVEWESPSSSNNLNGYACNGKHNITIDHDECEALGGTYLFAGLLPGLGQMPSVSTVKITNSRIIAGAWSSPSTQTAIYLNCPTGFEMEGGCIISASGTLGPQTIFAAAPSHIKLSGVATNAVDPFVGDGDAQSLIEILGCIPTDNRGNRLATGNYSFGYPFFAQRGPFVVLTDEATVSMILTDRATYYLQMSSTWSSRTIVALEKLQGSKTTLVFQQPVSGGCSITWGSGFANVIWADGSAPVLDPTPSSYTIIFIDVIVIGGTFYPVVRASASSTNINTYGSLKSASPTAGIGYAAGAGGVTTQAGGKTSGVTLNKASGSIVMTTSSLASGGIASFTFSNSVIASNDALLVWPKSGAAVAGSYRAWASDFASMGGSCVVNVQNVGATTLAEAVVIGFNVMKGTTD